MTINYNISLEEYYKNPIMESWTYVSNGMSNLKNYDPEFYAKIEEKRTLLLPQIKEQIAYINQVSEELGLNWKEAEVYIAQFLEKFPLALKHPVAWDDSGFIFLYLLARVLKPKVIIETGTNIGFSSTFIALAVKENNNNCKFYTIEPRSDYPRESLAFVECSDIRKQKIDYSKLTGKCEPLGIAPPDLKENIILKKGYSRDILPLLLEENGSVDIFFHDSDHSYRNTIWECATVLPRIKSGGYLVAHDIVLNSAFREMFGNRGSLTVRENLGVYRKTGEYFIIDKDWFSPCDNSRLNDSEYESRKIRLESSPKKIIIQLDNICDLNCVFCSGQKGSNNSGFDNFYQKLEGRISRYISQAEKIVFRACGSFGGSSEIERMIKERINCIALSFPETEKIYFTNGFDLMAEVSDFITSPYGINRDDAIQNTINILLHASNSKLYKILTRSDDFSKLLSQIELLIKLRKDNNSNLKVHFIFFATTLNIEDLPNFVKLACNMGVDKVISSYGYIYTPTQKYLSCFFKQEKTNEILLRTEDLAKELKIEVLLPPKFNQKDYPRLDICRKAWEQIAIDTNGNILTCDTNEICNKNLLENNFMDIWNGDYYQSLRKGLVENNRECFKYCLKANPQAVNDFRSHVICRGRQRSDIDILWGDNF